LTALEDFFRPYVDFAWFDGVGCKKNADTPMLSYPLVLGGKAPFTRKQLQTHFEKNEIQARTIFTGNITRQPVMKGKTFKGSGNYPEADHVMQNGILLGAHQGMTKEEINYIKKVFTNFAKKYK
jgi:CDP-4-dehydro-6-deoxyglucose reductase, E1